MTYTLKGQTAPLSVRIPFDPPLLGYEEVKPRLMSMKVDAEEALGMVRLLFTMHHFLTPKTDPPLI